MCVTKSLLSFIDKTHKASKTGDEPHTRYNGLDNYSIDSMQHVEFFYSIEIYNTTAPIRQHADTRNNRGNETGLHLTSVATTATTTNSRRTQEKHIERPFKLDAVCMRGVREFCRQIVRMQEVSKCQTICFWAHSAFAMCIAFHQLLCQWICISCLFVQNVFIDIKD